MHGFNLNLNLEPMKKHYYLYIITMLALMTVLPAAVRAEEATDDGTVQTSASADIEIRTETRPAMRPGVPVPAILREQLRTKAENIQNNLEARNKLLENRKLSTSTKPLMPKDVRMMASSTPKERAEIREERREDVKNIRQEGREDMKNASGTMERREIRKDMRMDIFKTRKEAIIKQLTVSLNNLKQIRERIGSRIEKATSEGRDLTKAKELLITADAKITAAINAVEALKAYMPGSVTATSSVETSTEASVDLNKPRQMGEAAIKAIKDAHEALVAVVRAIAQAMGLGNNASTTPR